MASISKRVGASLDDGYWYSGAANQTSATIMLGLSSHRSGAMRFTGLSALDGATITAATLTLTSSGNQSSTVTFRIVGVATDGFTLPSIESGYTGASRTTADVSWPISSSWSTDGTYDSPDITSIIQEMASNGYLASGSATIFVEWTSGSNRRDAHSWDGDSAKAPLLYVEYSTIIEQSLSDSSTITATESLEISATLPLSDSGTITATDELAVSATLPLADAGTITATDDLAVAASFTLTDAGTVTAAENLAVEIIDHVSLSDSGTITATESLAIGPGLVDDGTITATEALTVDASVPLADSGTITATETMQIAFDLTDAGTITAAEALAISATVPLADSGTVTATEHLQIKSIDIVTEPRVALDVYDLSGNRLGSGPIATPLAASYSMRADEIGTFTATVPAIAANADVLAAGREIRIRRAGEGEVFRGILDQPKVVIGEDGAILLELAGQSTAARLVWANTLLGRTFAGTTAATAVSTLLTGTGWTAGSVDSATISARFDGATIWKALRNIAETLGWHAVENPLTQQVSLAAASGSSGLVFRQVDHAGPDMAVVPLTGLTIPATEQAIWNRIIPLGAGEGINALSLRFSSRSSPYTIQTATGPDGNIYWYLEDAASVAAYGTRTQVLKFDEIAPLSNSSAEETAAANTLYDAASAWLGYYANPTEFYEASVVGLTHYAGGTPRFTIGQTVRLQWTGIVTDDAGSRLWKSVDASVYLMGFEREFHENGSDSWRLELATVDRRQPGPGDAIVKAIDDLWAIKTAMRPYTYREVHGPYRESVDSTHDATVTIDYDDSVTYLHRAELRLVKRKVRSNVSTAAAGGSPTSNATTTAANAGGGVTSAGGTSHTHSISAAVTSDDIGEHYHQIGQAQPTSSWTDPGYLQQMVFASTPGGALNYGIYGGRNGTEGSAQGLWTSGFTFHKHNITATATNSESSHTHTLPTHTHTINDHSHTMPTHTHSLNYGIYEGPAASTPAFGIKVNAVDVTSALGGPWNGDVVLDITPWLVDANGHILRQGNSLVVSSNQLCDVELTVKSFVSALSVVPV